MSAKQLLVTCAVLAGLAASQGPASAAALICDTQTATVCRITTLRDLGAGGTFEVDRSLHIMGAPAELRTAPGSVLTLTIAGDLIVHSGGKITGSASSPGGRGATITVDVAGQILLAGDGSVGAWIAADQKAGSCTTGRGGDITLRSSSTLGGEAVVIQAGASVTANAACSGGAIRILAPGGKIGVAGLVESFGSAPGSGGAARKPGGGPIAIEAGCDLTVADTGHVSSRGRDPGADLVRLAGGCDVLVAGLVESTGPGHGAPNSPPNHCAGPDRPGKPANATACVEIWAGNRLTIDSAGLARGQVSADTAMSGGSQIAWIDLIAGGAISIAGSGAGPYPPGDRPYAVHANQFVSNSRGGLITVKSLQGGIALAGRAIQADGGLGASGTPVLGGKGGAVTLEAGGVTEGLGNVDLGSASVRARGATAGGTGKAGGTIAARSFNGRVLGANPGELDASGGGTPGSVTLRACAGAEYTGTSAPAAIVPAGACGGVPALPSYVSLPECQCQAPPPCTGPECGCVGSSCPCEGPNCAPPCEGPDCGGPRCEGPGCQPDSFCPRGTVQAILHPLTGRFPGNLGPDVVVKSSLDLVQAAVDAAADVNGDGYIIVGVLPEPPPPPTLGDGAKKELRIERFYERPFALIGCGVTITDPANCNSVPPVHIAESAGSPVHPLGSNITLYVLDFGVKSSTSAPGFLVEGDGRQLDEIRAHGNLIGVKILGDDNVVRNGVIDGSLADGLVVEGSGNVIEGTGVFSNGGHGMRITGDRNRVLANTAGGQLAGNAGDGINVRGQGNLVRGNAAYGNAGDGIDVSGGTAAAPNLLKKNRAGAPQLGNGAHGILLGGTGSGPSNPVEVDGNQAHGNSRAGIKITGTGQELRDNASGGPGALNGGCEYEVAAGNINATGNKAGSSSVAGADGSPFPAGCTQALF